MNSIFPVSLYEPGSMPQLRLISGLDPLITSVWSDAAVVLPLVKNHLKHLAPVNALDQKIVFGSWNMEYMWQAKAQHYLDVYKEIISRHHILAVQEATARGLSTIGKACGYNCFSSQPNSRGQAVGFLIHPRFTVSSVCEYPQLINVYGIFDLRPALRLDIIDQQSKLSLSIITLHLKSMRGGLAFTSRVRKRQLEQLSIALGDNQSPTIIAGDFNCFLDLSDDLDPLYKVGYKLNNPNNHTSTQSSGGRLDGLVYKNLPPMIRPGAYNIGDFWRGSPAGHSLSDHGLLSWKLNMSC